jgi:CheY-like chemotaxis protein
MIQIEQKILIVDDSKENIFVMQNILENSNATLVTALSGNEALKILIKEDISLILLDIQMPGMDGYETAQLIRGSLRTKHIPIIFVTAINNNEKNVIRGYQSGGVDFIFKPADPTIVRSKVQIFLEMDRQRRILEIQNDKLRRARENTHNILVHAEEGLFLLDNDFKIKPDYSRAMDHIFGQSNLGNRDFISLLRPYIKKYIDDDVRTYLELMFDKSITVENFSDLNPLELLEYKTDKHLKYLSFSTKRIFKDNEIRELIVTVSDISESVELEKQLEETAEQSKKQMEMLSLIETDPHLLKEFQKQTLKEIIEIENHLKTLKKEEDINRLYSTIHAIKGNASMLNLNYISEKAHAMEDAIVALNFDIEKTKENYIDLSEKLYEIKERIDDINVLIEKTKVFYECFSTKSTAAGDLIIKAIESTMKNNAISDKKIVFDYSAFEKGHFGAEEFIFLRDIVVQLTRNTLAHGLDLSQANYIPKISLKSGIENKKLILEYQDNGKGLQYDKIIEKAISSKLLKLEDIGKMSDQELASLIFRVGISTSEKAGMISGRGMGMNFIKRKIEEYGGSIEVDSKPHQHCRFKMILPVN